MDKKTNNNGAFPKINNIRAFLDHIGEALNNVTSCFHSTQSLDIAYIREEPREIEKRTKVVLDYLDKLEESVKLAKLMVYHSIEQE